METTLIICVIVIAFAGAMHFITDSNINNNDNGFD